MHSLSLKLSSDVFIQSIESNIPSSLLNCNSPSVLIYDPNVAEQHIDFVKRLKHDFDIAAELPIDGPDPEGRFIEKLAEECRAVHPNTVISLGGGSTIDTAKGVSHLVPSPLGLSSVYESPGRFDSSLRHIAIPTTSGPGAEFSPAMIYSKSNGTKVALVDERLIPSSVLIIPELATTLSSFETACCLFDAISHSIEGWISTEGREFTRELHLSALHTFIGIFKQLMREPGNVNLRERVSVATMLSSQAVRLSGAGVGHALMTNVASTICLPHGAAVGLGLLVVLSEDMQMDFSKQHPLHNLAMKLDYNNGDELVTDLCNFFETYILSKKLDDMPQGDNFIDFWTEIACSDPRLSSHPTIINKPRIKSFYQAALNVLSRKKNI